MHASEVEKPFLTVADLHLILKTIEQSEAVGFTPAECDRLDELEEMLDLYLMAAVGIDWDTKEALV